MGDIRRLTVMIATVTVFAGLVGQGVFGAASADSCLSADQTGVCFPTQNTTLVPSETVGGPIVVPGQTVGGDITGGAIPVNSPTQVCYLLGCIDQGQTIATVPDVTVPPVTVPSETVPVPQETTPAVVLPFDPTKPQLEGLPNLDTAFVVGTGTVSPGLSTVPTVQTSVTFNANIAAFAGDEGEQLCSFNFSGSSTGVETELAGQGSGAVSGCFGGFIAYQRTANIMTISGSLFSGDNEVILAMICLWSPTSILPTTSYMLECTAALSSPSG